MEVLSLHVLLAGFVSLVCLQFVSCSFDCDASAIQDCVEVADEVPLLQQRANISRGQVRSLPGKQAMRVDDSSIAVPVAQKNSTCENDKPGAIYVGHLENEGIDCWDHCGRSGGYCDYCGIGNVCCAPGGSHDVGCHHETCKHTKDWSHSFHSRRRHHFCGEANTPPLSPEEESVPVPYVRTSTRHKFETDNIKLDSALQVYKFAGVVPELLRFFEFIPSVHGYIAQFKIPKGDFQTKSCDLEGLSNVLRDNEKLELIGAGYSYYLQKRMPQAPSINMQGCKCVEVDPVAQSATLCAASTMADALEELESHGLKIRTMGTYHHLSFGGAIAVFNHGSDHRYTSLIDTLNWMEYFDLVTKTHKRETNLSKIKQVIANRSYIMTRANVNLESDFTVVSVHSQSKGHTNISESFLATLEDIRSLHVFVPYETNGSYVAGISGYRTLTAEQVTVLSKKGYRPHACALRYRDCSTLDFFLRVAEAEEFAPADTIKDSLDVDFEVDGHLVKASEVEFSWAMQAAFGQRLFGALPETLRGTSKAWEFEFCVHGLELPELLTVWHDAVQAWSQRLAHTFGVRRGACANGVCSNWAGFYFTGDRAGFVTLWTKAVEVMKEYEIYVHLGKEQVEEVRPHREVHIP